MLKLLAVFLILLSLPLACTTEPTDEPTGMPEVSAAITGVHHAMCGCSIDGIGSCGNYVQIEGEYVKLVHPDLGSMQFCKEKEKGVDIEIAGEMKGGEFVAQSWEIVK